MSLLSARQRAGLTQEEVAKELGVRQAAVSFWENGKTAPRARLLLKLASIYGCTTDELLDPGSQRGGDQ